MRRLGLAKRVFSCYPAADVELLSYRSQQGSPRGAGPSPPDEVCLTEQSVLSPWQDRDACLAFFSVQPRRWEIPPLDHAPCLTSQQVLPLPGGGSARCTLLSVKEGEELLLGSSVLLLPLQMLPDARQESVMSSSLSTRKRQGVNFRAQQ